MCMCPQHLEGMANLLEGSQDKEFLYLSSWTNIFVCFLLSLGLSEKGKVERKKRKEKILLRCYAFTLWKVKVNEVY